MNTLQKDKNAHAAVVSLFMSDTVPYLASSINAFDASGTGKLCVSQVHDKR